MGRQQFCDICKFYKPSVKRYGLSRQEPIPGMTRGPNDSRAKTRHVRGFGGIDLCDECWEQVAKPNTRPELVGKTGPKPGPKPGPTADGNRT